MIFSNKETIKDLIIKYLLINNYSVEELQDILKKKENIEVSIFGLYKILRNLKREEGSVVKVGKNYSVSEEWKKKVLESMTANTSNDIKLDEGEKIDFKFKSLINLDFYWKNLVLSFHIKNDFPIYLYAKHQFWMMLNNNREKSEKEYINYFNKEKILAIYSIPGNDVFDKLFKKKFSSDYVKINTNEENLLANNQQLAIFDDYIIITVIPKNIQNKIDEYYKKENDINTLKEKIEKLHIENKNARLIVERNKKKAKMLRKKLSKNFFIPKDLIEKYDLF